MVHDCFSEIVTMDAAARELGRSASTLRTYVRTGQLRGLNADGRVWIFRRRDVEALKSELAARDAGLVKASAR